MQIKNKAFLKWPWLFPVLAVAGTAIGMAFSPDARRLGRTTDAVIFIATNILFDAWFFWTLRHTRQQQGNAKAATAKSD